MRRLLLRLLYGGPAGSGLRAIERRCEAIGVRVCDVMTQAGIEVRRAETALFDRMRTTRVEEATSRLRRHFPRLPARTAHAVVLVAYEGLDAADAGHK